MSPARVFLLLQFSVGFLCSGFDTQRNETHFLPSYMMRLEFRDRHWIVTFDLSPLLSERHVQAVELRFRAPATTGSPDAPVELRHHRVTRPCPRHRVCVEEQSLGFLPESSLLSSSTQWRVYNVTARLLRWTDHMLAQRKRRIMRTKVRGRGPPDVKVPSAGTNRALLVVFSQEGPRAGRGARQSKSPADGRTLQIPPEHRGAGGPQGKETEKPPQERQEREREREREEEPLQESGHARGLQPDRMGLLDRLPQKIQCLPL
ncbi:hypothetical protein Baya_16417 [Bagarius yarrelli]|uniref:Uncharacterized protein n=1 Tax=Bagarius yarrelli TaxID=175774 RepID=A0A556VVP2_BAGYA|nr:hypothetical protein Baya_16417 [Bagarius yarrelli]